MILMSDNRNDSTLINIKEAINDHVVIRFDKHLRQTIIKLELHLMRLPNNYFLTIFKHCLDIWIRRPLPLFNIKAGPSDRNWSLRIREEKRVFRILKKHNPFSNIISYQLLENADSKGKKWILIYLDTLTYQPKHVEITIPNNYPRTPPVVHSHEIKKLDQCLNKADENIASLWRKDGRYGIPHFLAYFFSPLLYMTASILKIRKIFQ